MENTNNPLKKPLGKWWSERTKTQKIWVIAIVIAFGVGVAIMGNNSPSACDCANIIEESPMNAPLDPNGNMREDADKYVQKEKACIKKYVKLDATQKALLDASTDMTYFQGELDQAIENAKKECNKEDVSATDELKPKKNSSATVEIHKDSALKEKEQNKSNNDTVSNDTLINNQIIIGAKLFGGIIIYIDETKKHGIIMSEIDLGDGNWSHANELCKSYSAGGKKVWRLPTIDELRVIYKSKNLTNNFQQNWYWSSNESGENAMHLGFISGDEGFVPKKDGKFVRAVRNF